MIDWLKKNYMKFLPLVTILAGVVGSAIGVKITVKPSNVDQPEINILIPSESGRFTKVPVTYTATVEEKKK